MRYYIENEYYLHVFTSIWQGDIRCSEEVEYGVKKSHTHDGEKGAQDEIERDGIAKHILSRGIVLLTKTHTDYRTGTHTHHGTKGGTQVHEGKGGRESTQCQRAHIVSDEGAVYNVVQRTSHHSCYGWQGITHQESANGFFAQFSRYSLSHNECQSYKK